MSGERLQQAKAASPANEEKHFRRLPTTAHQGSDPIIFEKGRRRVPLPKETAGKPQCDQARISHRVFIGGYPTQDR